MNTLAIHRTTHYTPEAARMTKRDWKKAAELLEGVEGEHNGKEVLFREGRACVSWYGHELTATRTSPPGYEEHERDDKLQKLDIDEEQAIWLLNDLNDSDPEVREEAKNELTNLFIEAACR